MPGSTEEKISLVRDQHLVIQGSNNRLLAKLYFHLPNKANLMLKKFSFWIRAAIVFQLLTTAMHSVSFFITPIATNEEESQMLKLITTYKMDMGNGIFRTYSEIVISLSINLTLLCLFSALLNIFLVRSAAQPKLFRGILLLQVIIFGILLIFFLRYAFLPPILCVALVLLGCVGSYFSIRPLLTTQQSTT